MRLGHATHKGQRRRLPQRSSSAESCAAMILKDTSFYEMFSGEGNLYKEFRPGLVFFVLKNSNSSFDCI